MSFLLAFVFFASGACALLFETLWFRQAGLAFGNTVWASALVLAGFMTGLAVGNGLAARFGPRLESPLRTYAWLEVAIAASGMALVFVLPSLTPWLAPIQRGLSDAPTVLQLVRFALALALLSLPALAMGMTLPLLVDSLVGRDAGAARDFGRVLSFLYGANTLGAVAGAVAGEVLLVERLGVVGTAGVAASLDLAAALVVGALATRRRESRPSPARGPASARRGPAPLLAAAFLAGGVLLALEVVWFRLLLLFVAGTRVAFALPLAVVLGGIGLGSLAAAPWLAARAAAHRAGWASSCAGSAWRSPPSSGRSSCSTRRPCAPGATGRLRSRTGGPCGSPRSSWISPR